MPSIKHRQRVIARAFISSSPQYVETTIPWNQFFLAASPVANFSASVASYQISGSIASIRYTGTKNTCPLTIPVPLPLNAAIAAPAAASGTVYVDWADMTANATNVAMTASLWLIPSGSGLGDTATCTLGTAASGTTMTSGCINKIVSTSLFSFNAPTARGGTLALRLIVDSADAGNTTGSNFAMTNVRLRIATDRIGS